MSRFLTPVQQAIYTRLNSVVVPLGTATAIYDDVPSLPEGMPDADFPYIVIGDTAISEWDTDDVLGASVIATIHVWSRYRGLKETKLIMSQIDTALHRASVIMIAAGYRFVDCLHESSSVFTDPDGITRHGICRYHITVEQE